MLLELTPSLTHGQSMTGLPLHSQLITAAPAIKPHIYANISTPLTASVNIDITQHNQHIHIQRYKHYLQSTNEMSPGKT